MVNKKIGFERYSIHCRGSLHHQLRRMPVSLETTGFPKRA
jgi:hypothetical protein